MYYLIIVSVIWAFSFGLIKGQLADLDTHFVSFARLFLSLVFFLPFLRLSLIRQKGLEKLLLIGVVQFGLMYILYINAYPFLQAWQIALFTILTPLYVALIADLLERRFRPRYLLAALLAIAGAAILVFREWQHTQMFTGFLLVQASNICFAFGQIYYKRVRPLFGMFKDKELFVFLYAGAVLIAGLNSALMTPWTDIDLKANHIYTLFYLGIIASGLCFFLWNLGATKTNAGVLAVMNNLKIPLGVLFALLFFGESADLLRLLFGSLLMLGALAVAYAWPVRMKRSSQTEPL